MSEVQSIGSTQVRAAIARAANRSGVDFDYLLAQARIESSLDPSARAATSSAAGLYQFTSATWLRTLDAHGAEHGLGWASAAIEDGRVRDPALRAQVMALRFDPDAAAAMAAELAGENAEALAPVLGRAPDGAELYLAHFLGSRGAAEFLSALRSDPDQSAVTLMPKAAAANRSIFFETGGAPRTVGAVMALLRGKVAGAMESGKFFAPSSTGEMLGVGANPRALGLGPYDSPRPTSSLNEDGLTQPLRPSMADTLRDAFGLASAHGQANAPSFVRAAYGSLKGLGL